MTDGGVDERTVDRWYVARGGVTSPPQTWEQVVAAARAGTIAPDDLLWAEGDAKSQRAGEVSGLLPEMPAAESEAGLMLGRGDPQQPALRILNRRGRLQLYGDRLRFVAARGQVLLDAPLAELHSVSPAEGGDALEVWHGSTRHRFLVPGTSEIVTVTPGLLPPVLAIAQLPAAVQAMRANRIVVHRWAALLGPVVAPGPPPGVTVRPPRRGAAFVALMAIKGVVLLAALAAVTIVPLVIAAG